ncbi:MAG: hypothetical protein K2X07_10770 [Caulobacteraceae bacterium]|nr:hypothetical protein [Caulobacteraceae bacterium]
MLSPEEITVGNFASAQPGSLVLPRTKYEARALICEGDGEPTAVFLSGDYAFRSFPSGGADNWKGVVVPDVRIEIDETSLADPDRNGHALGVVVREETKLIVRTMAEHCFGRSVPVVIQSGLPEARGSAAFMKWQIVIGHGDEKRVLHKVDLAAPPTG